MSRSERELIREHFNSIGGHVRQLALAYRGEISDREIVERMESIALAAEAYGAYHGREHPPAGRDPVLTQRGPQTYRAVGDFLRQRSKPAIPQGA